MGRLVILLLLVASCFGQVSQNVVYQSGSLSVGIPVLLLPSNNIGQSSHILQVVFSNAPAKTCTAIGLQAITNVRLEGSFDKSIWVGVGASITAPAIDNSGAIIGSTVVFGSYPFIRIDPLGWDVTNCVAAYSYSGSLYPTSINTVLMGVGTNYLSFQNENTSGAGTYVLRAALAGTRLVLYGLSIQNEGGSATPILIRDEVGGACGGTILGNILGITSTGMPANSSLVWPTSTAPYYVSPNTGSSFCLTLSNANVVSLNLVYRLE